MSGKRDKERYDYCLIKIPKGSTAEKGLRRDAKRLGFASPAALISALLEDRYERLDGTACTEPSIWFPDPRLLLMAQGQLIGQVAGTGKAGGETTDPGVLESVPLQAMEDNLDDFLSEL